MGRFLVLWGKVQDFFILFFLDLCQKMREQEAKGTCLCPRPSSERTKMSTEKGRKHKMPKGRKLSSSLVALIAHLNIRQSFNLVTEKCMLLNNVV